MISKEKQLHIENMMHRLNILESDIDEQFVTGSGKGGQKINNTHSMVQLKHIPTGIVIQCQKERSRETNRFLARRILCEKIEQIQLGKKSASELKIEKIKKQKARRKRRNKAANE